MVEKMVTDSYGNKYPLSRFDDTRSWSKPKNPKKKIKNILGKTNAYTTSR